MVNAEAVMVLTSKSLETMFQEGGCGYWAAKEERVRRCQYVVAVSNTSSVWSQHGSAESAAFMIGRISDISRGEDSRLLIKISEYAEIAVPNAWPRGNRNPVTYTSLDQLGIEASSLTWTPFPKDQAVEPEARPLTIQEAKRGIARALGIGPECIEITIRT